MADGNARRAKYFLVAAVVALACMSRPFTSIARADDPLPEVCDKTWAFPVSGSWHTADAWLPIGEPAATDHVCITEPGDYTVTIDQLTSASAATLALGGVTGTATLVIDGANLNLANGGEVQPTGAVTLTNSGAVATDAALSAGDVFTNAGVLRAEATGGGARVVHGPMTNTGTVTVEAQLDYGADATLTNAGTVSVVAGGRVCICGSSTTHPVLDNATGSVANAGTVTLTSATMKQGSGANTGFPPVVQQSTLEFTGDGASAFLVERSDNHLVGNIGAHQVLTLLATAATGDASLQAGADVTNAGSILIRSTDATKHAVFAFGGPSDANTLTNTSTGALRVVAGAAGVHELHGNLVNGGTVAVNHDARFDDGTFSNNGAVSVATDTTFTVGASAGFVNDTGGAVTNNTGFLSVATGAVWEQGAGTTTGAVRIQSGADLRFTGSGASAFAVVGSGTIAGDIAARQSVLVTTPSTRSFAASFTNAGIITLATTAVAETSLTFPTGTTFTNTGTLHTARLAATHPFVTIAGATIVNDGTLDIDNHTHIDSSGGITNGGTIDIATGITLATTAPYTQTSTGALRIAITGATTFSRLAVGDAALDGALTATGTYDPPTRTVFPVVTHAARTGGFATTDFNSRPFTVNYGSSEVDVVSADRPPDANAGSDVTVGSGKTFNLDGRGSTDPEGQPLTYLWETTEPIVIRNRETGFATVDGVTGPATVTFRLTVTDAAGNTDHDDVVVTVQAPK